MYPGTHCQAASAEEMRQSQEPGTEKKGKKIWSRPSQTVVEGDAISKCQALAFQDVEKRERRKAA